MKAVSVNRNGAIFIPRQSLKNYVMKNLFCLLASILALTLHAQQPNVVSINLNQSWKFIQGDNLEYAQPGYNDSGWKNIQVDRVWEASGYDPYDGYAWYLIEVVIPSSLKNSTFLKDSLRIYLGKINNFDQTFLNGSFIGNNSKNVPAGTVPDTLFKNAPKSLWDVKRPYTLSVNDPRIKWDEKNLIAVRVFDEGGQGGLYTGDQAISMTKISDYLAIDNNKISYKFENSNLSKTIALRNISESYIIEGDFSIKAINKLTGEEIYNNETKKLLLKPGQNQTFVVALKKLDQSAIITYKFDFTKSGISKIITDETPYITTPLAVAEPRINGASVTADRSFDSWGVDYLKYDWCSYDGIAKDTTLAEYKKPYFVMRDALAKVNRDIVYSLCQYGMGNVWEWGNEVGGNLWSTTGDITDTWKSLCEIGFGQVSNQPFAKPGNWNDPDMLIVGWVGWGPSLHPTRLAHDDQYTHISLWCLLSAPLLIGCDLQRLDDFTLNLLTNDEVIAIDQDPLGSQAKRVLVDGDIQVWVKELVDGSKAIGVFNLSDKTMKYDLNFEKAGLKTGGELHDLWRQKNLGKSAKTMYIAIPSHGVMLLKLK